MLILYRFEPNDAYKKNAYKKLCVLHVKCALYYCLGKALNLAQIFSLFGKTSYMGSFSFFLTAVFLFSVSLLTWALLPLALANVNIIQTSFLMEVFHMVWKSNVLYQSSFIPFYSCSLRQWMICTKTTHSLSPLVLGFCLKLVIYLICL